MSSSSLARTGSKYEATVAHLRRVLGGFAPDYGDAQRSGQEYVLKVPPSKLPVAVLAREVMAVFGAADLGAEDKVAWCYGFTADGVPCTLASTKWVFGCILMRPSVMLTLPNTWHNASWTSWRLRSGWSTRAC